MPAWKSSDGGSIHKLGNSQYSGTVGVTSVDLVTAAANTAGVTLWTGVIRCVAAGNRGQVKAGGLPILAMSQTGTGTLYEVMLTYPIFIPAGKALAVEGLAGNASFFLSYDVH